MSYDGGVTVYIKNKKLKKLMAEYEGQEVNFNLFLHSKKYDFEYDYGDCAYVSGCPKDLDDLEWYLLDLFEVYNDDQADFDKFKQSFEENYSEIKDGFTYVLWEFSPPDIARDECYDGKDLIQFEYGPIKKNSKKATSENTKKKETM